MGIKINKRYAFIIFFYICVFILMPFKVAQADADLDLAINRAPQGLNLTDIFLPGTFLGNTARIIDVDNANAMDTDAVQITSAKKQIGSIWSTDSNFFDLNKKQVMSMWMYFGNSKTPGEGMAFVLQNDPRDFGAISTDLWTGILGNTKKPTGGETLGVWGVDTHSDISDTTSFATTAIQNSWALEFDTHINSTDTYFGAGNADSFDVQNLNSKQHIAANYPGEASSYFTQMKSVGVWPLNLKNYYNYLNHSGLIENVELTNGSWHHLTMTWIPGSSSIGKMNYVIDDINLEGTKNINALSNSFDIDTTKLKSSDGRVRWGFTGSTSDFYENNLVIFESIPDLVNATIESHIYTDSGEIKEGDSIASGKKIKVSYNLKYSGGRRDWKNIVASIHLPGITQDPDKPTAIRNNITYTDAKITYDDIYSETISLSGMTNNQINNYILSRSLSTTNPVAEIEFNGNTEVNRDTEIPAEASKFKSINFIDHVDTPKFTIQSDKDLIIGITSGTNNNINANTDANIKGLILYAGGSTNIDNSGFKVYSIVNGKTGSNGSMSETESGFFNLTVKSSDLNFGKNTVEVYVTDEYGNKSNVIEITITVIGYLDFNEISRESSFKFVNYSNKSKIIKRNKDWKLSVKDARGIGNGWRVTASSTELKNNEGIPLHGGMVFKDSDSDLIVSIVNNSTTIMEHINNKSKSEEIFDIVKSWNDDEGILLKISSNEVSGVYEGTISWDLYDSV